MKLKIAKGIILALSASMAMSLAGCSTGAKDETTTSVEADSSETEKEKEEASKSGYDSIVTGLAELNGIFNPFFYTSAFDSYVFGPVFTQICTLSDDNTLVESAGSISSEEVKNDAGQPQTKYTIKIKEGMTFSDGKPVTIDDVIFGYYVQADPNYSGMSTLSSLDIVGLKEYYYDSEDYAEKIEQFKNEAKTISDAEFEKYADEYTKKTVEENTPQTVNEELGLGVDEGATDFKEQVIAKYLEKNIQDEELKEQAKSEKFDNLKKAYIEENLSGGVNVEKISGIQKVDDLTCTVLINGFSLSGDRMLSLSAIMPKHYYGVADDGTEFKKGDMTIPKSRNEHPLGAGPYVFDSYDNNLVTLSANENYFEGAPKTPYLKFQVVSESNKVEVIANGEMDITDPSAQIETMERLKSEGIEYNLTDNNGYGYIGINSERIPDINVRKGLMHLMNRAPAINSYYGDLAEVLERPLTSTLAEYPQDAKPYYDYNKEKAAECFAKGGYKKDANGKLVNGKGEQLKIEIGIGSLSSHPSAGILSQMKNDMTELGAEFIVSDLQFNVLSDRINTGNIDMFALAFGATDDADVTQIYHSSSAEGSGSNYFKLRSDKVDDLIEQIRVTLDLEKRKELVSQMLDEIMENAVIMPVYQRKNLNIFNKESLKMDTVYRSESPYHTYRDSYHTIEMN